MESGGTASWLSQPFEDFSCRDGKRERINFQGKGGGGLLLFEVEDKMEKSLEFCTP